MLLFKMVMEVGMKGLTDDNSQNAKLPAFAGTKAMTTPL